MAKTYIPIQTITTSNNTTTDITFSSIPSSTYDDLRIVIACSFVNTGLGGSNSLYIKMHPSSTAYFWSGLAAYPSSLSSYGANGSYPGFPIEIYGYQEGDCTSMAVVDIFNYWQTSSGIMRSICASAGGASGTGVSGGGSARAWISTGSLNETSAISSVTVSAANSSYPFKQNSYFTLYGIKGS